VKHNRIAIIPARGGSKRLPRKNVLPLHGKPLITYPIKAAIKSGLFKSVVVSTEDDNIADIAASAGSKVINRPKELAEDRSTVVQVCAHALNLHKEKDELPEIFCCIYATAVFITANDLHESLALIDKNPEVDCVMGVSDFNLQPVQALEENGGYLKFKWPEYNKIQSQFQPKLLASNGTIYWARSLTFLKNRTFYGKRLKGYFIPQTRSMDIDTQSDFEFARILASFILQKNKNL
jgi:N-acylneuraminate cytidylyltransferase